VSRDEVLDLIEEMNHLKRVRKLEKSTREDSTPKETRKE
jgi:hypothetical protein